MKGANESKGVRHATSSLRPDLRAQYKHGVVLRMQYLQLDLNLHDSASLVALVCGPAESGMIELDGGDNAMTTATATIASSSKSSSKLQAVGTR